MLSILERAEASLNSSLQIYQWLRLSFKNHSKILIEIKNFLKVRQFQLLTLKNKSQYKVSKLNVESAKYAIISSEASVKEAKENLAKTKIYAPKNGTISRLNVEIGERVDLVLLR